MPLVFSLVKVWPSHLLFALLYLLEEVQLTHLLEQLLILPLLLRHLLLLQLLLLRVVLEVALRFLVLL